MIPILRQAKTAARRGDVDSREFMRANTFAKPAPDGPSGEVVLRTVQDVNTFRGPIPTSPFQASNSSAGKNLEKFAPSPQRRGAATFPSITSLSKPTAVSQ